MKPPISRAMESLFRVSPSTLSSLWHLLRLQLWLIKLAGTREWSKESLSTLAAELSSASAAIKLESDRLPVPVEVPTKTVPSPADSSKQGETPNPSGTPKASAISFGQERLPLS